MDDIIREWDLPLERKPIVRTARILHRYATGIARRYKGAQAQKDARAMMIEARDMVTFARHLPQ